MLNHVSLKVSDIVASRLFFTQALKPLGYSIFVEHDDSVGFGQKSIPGHCDFWISSGRDFSVNTIGCVAFNADRKEQVQAFHEAAIKAGGSDNGAPGYRPQYHSGYYGAFVIGPDGYNVEAVFDDWEKLTDEEKL